MTKVGDIDGDGTPDLLVGSSSEEVRGTLTAGRAYLISGATGESLKTFSSPDSERGGWFGASVAGVGDINGDGTLDLLIGAPLETPGGTKKAGRVYLFSGATGKVIQTLTSPNPSKWGHFGFAVTGVGDANRDGTPDLLVGAPLENYSHGRAYLMSGATGKVLETFTSPNSVGSGQFGSAVAEIGDISGDGTPDLVVGARGENPGDTEKAGRAYLISGGSGKVLHTLTSPNPEKEGFFGGGVAGVGDINQDGTPDLLVGADKESSSGTETAGRAYLLSGATGEVIETLVSPNPEREGYFGASVAGMGDKGGDSVPNLLVGANGEGVDGVQSAGQVYRFQLPRASARRVSSQEKTTMQETSETGKTKAEPPKMAAPDAVTLPPDWQSADGRWWREGVDTSEVFLNRTMGIDDQTVQLQRGNVSRDQFKTAIKQGLAVLNRHNPTIVDTLFETYAAPKLEDVDLSGDIIGENGQLKDEILNKGKNVAYKAITERYREPRLERSPDSINFAFSDSQRSEARVVELQVYLSPEWAGDNPVARPDAVKILSGIHPALNKIAVKAATQATWEPAYLLKDGNWTPVESWVRFKIPLRMSSEKESSTQETQSAAAQTAEESTDARTDASRTGPSSGQTTAPSLDGTPDARYTAPDAKENEEFGNATAGAGDVDGDGVPDLLVGDPGGKVKGKAGAGRAYLFSGATESALRTLTSPAPEKSGEFGRSVAGVGDVSGDGTPDLLVGAPGEATGAGRAHLLSGDTGEVLETLTSPNREGRTGRSGGGGFGESVAGIGDVNGDGTPDVLVGARYEDVGQGATGNEGRVYLFSGATGQRLRTLTSPNADEEDSFGKAITAVGDVDGDGTPDLLAGANGHAYIFGGANGRLLQTLNPPYAESQGRFGTSFGGFGRSVAGVGDVDGDGTPDVLVGVPGADQGRMEDAGRAYLMSGATGDVLRRIASPQPEGDGAFGWAVAGAGDVDGDGTPDLFIGTVGEGRAYLISGVDGQKLQAFAAPRTGAGGGFGGTIGWADVAGDRAQSLLIGSGAGIYRYRVPQAESGVGATDDAQTTAVNSSTNTPEAKSDGASGSVNVLLQDIYSSPVPEAEGGFGTPMIRPFDGAVAEVGDLDDNDTPDVLVGASGESPRGIKKAGRAYLISGSSGEVLQTISSPNPEGFGHFGFSVAGIGDTDGDGAADLLVGAPGESPGGVETAGRAYLISGANGKVLQTLSNPEKSGRFGDSVAEIGDTDGDGVPDVLIGARKESPGGVGYAGRAYLISGASGEVLRTLTSPNPRETGLFGVSVAGVGDTDGDGAADLLVGPLGRTPVG